MVAAAAAGLAGLGAGLALRRYVLAQGAEWPAWSLAGGTAVLWALAAAAFGPHPRLLTAAGLTLCLWVAACIDLRTHRIPNPVVLAAFGVAGAAQCLGAGLVSPLPALVAGCCAGLVFSLLAALTRGGFGWGDAKLAAAMGCVLGPSAMLLALAATSLAGGLAGGVLLLTGRRGLRDPLPFAPFFLIGGLVALGVAARG